MLRTRDFLLFLVTAVFLLVGIGATLVVDADLRENNNFLPNVQKSEEQMSISATTSPDKVIDRAERLSAMREKLESYSFSGLYNELTNDAEIEAMEDFSKEPENLWESNEEIPYLCDGYSEQAIAWSPFGLEFEEIEGSRLIYRPLPESPTSNASGTASNAIPNREVVLQLSLRTIPLQNTTCLSSDVVGIAMDGSLIRNSEVSLYSIFDADTVVGYALDGFPIYGNNPNAVTDECGGVLAGDSYRYVISNQQDYILGCFSGSPAKIN